MRKKNSSAFIQIDSALALWNSVYKCK